MQLNWKIVALSILIVYISIVMEKLRDFILSFNYVSSN